jgi:hypothetical protein
LRGAVPDSIDLAVGASNVYCLQEGVGMGGSRRKQGRYVADSVGLDDGNWASDIYSTG